MLDEISSALGALLELMIRAIYYVVVLAFLYSSTVSLHTMAEQAKIAADNPECEWVAAMIEKEKRNEKPTAAHLDGRSNNFHAGPPR